MKNLILTIGSIVFIFTSCCKLEVKPSSDKENLGTKKYIYEPIVYSDDCNCIVKGKVKYIENGKTVALVDYGTGACDNFAQKTLCVDGKCEGGTVTSFQFDCAIEKVKEGDVNDDEKSSLGL